MNRQNKLFRVKGLSWWPQELPDQTELANGRRNLAKIGNEVDYVIAHCLPYKQACLLNEPFKAPEPDIIGLYFDDLINTNKIKFKKWICGHYHIDYNLNESFQILFTDIIQIL